MLVFCYVANLRFDVILYARVVNGIRKYFYDESNIDLNLKQRIKSLPQSPQLPSYYERSYFVPVVLVFGLMNSLYFLLGYYILAKNYIFYIRREYIFAGILLAGLILHVGIYFLFSRHRELSYLKSNILGVDIDGVLNKHREHFCGLLFEKTGKEIRPEQITIIPVHEHPSLGITRSHEREVFNDPKYWAEMPVVEGAVDNIRKLQNAFKLKIYLFTHRPWPDAERQEEVLRYNQQFRGCIKDPTRMGKEPLRQITIEWLNRSNFVYNKFFFEKGNDYSSDPRGEFRNRFYIARKKKIRFFVEDDYEKAIKLSYICDIVFLYSHPYNERDNSLSEDINKLRENLPSNVVRVKNWDEIYKGIRRFS